MVSDKVRHRELTKGCTRIVSCEQHVAGPVPLSRACDIACETAHRGKSARGRAPVWRDGARLHDFPRSCKVLEGQHKRHKL
eukprot:2651518-Amphidinium_carterae.2